jgi:hypothetical protein
MHRRGSLNNSFLFRRDWICRTEMKDLWNSSLRLLRLL